MIAGISTDLQCEVEMIFDSVMTMVDETPYDHKIVYIALAKICLEEAMMFETVPDDLSKM